MNETIDDVFPSASLKHDDLGGREHTLTIINAEKVQFENGAKIKLWFEETKKTLICNKTNSSRIGLFTNTKVYKDWVGQKIVVYPDITDVKGVATPCIRVKPPLQTASAPPPPRARPAQTFDDDIPF